MTAAHVLKERINNNNKKSRRQIESDLTKSRSLLTLQMRLHLPTYLRWKLIETLYNFAAVLTFAH